MPERLWKELQQSKWNNIKAWLTVPFIRLQSEGFILGILLSWTSGQIYLPEYQKSNFEQNKAKTFCVQGLIFGSRPARFFRKISHHPNRKGKRFIVAFRLVVLHFKSVNLGSQMKQDLEIWRQVTCSLVNKENTICLRYTKQVGSECSPIH